MQLIPNSGRGWEKMVLVVFSFYVVYCKFFNCTPCYDGGLVFVGAQCFRNGNLPIYYAVQQYKPVLEPSGLKPFPLQRTDHRGDTGISSPVVFHKARRSVLYCFDMVYLCVVSFMWVPDCAAIL